MKSENTRAGQAKCTGSDHINIPTGDGTLTVSVGYVPNPTVPLQFPFQELNIMALTVHELATSKGWHDQSGTMGQFVQRAVCNLHGEVSELFEAYRNGNLDKPCDKAEKMVAAGIEPLTCAEEEYADIIIRALDNCSALGIDIGRAVSLKHRFNSTREHRHGGKLA